MNFKVNFVHLCGLWSIPMLLFCCAATISPVTESKAYLIWRSMSKWCPFTILCSRPLLNTSFTKPNTDSMAFKSGE